MNVKGVYSYNAFHPGSSRKGDIAQAVLRLGIVPIGLVLIGLWVYPGDPEIRARWPNIDAVMLTLIVIEACLAVATLIAAFKAERRVRTWIRHTMLVSDYLILTALIIAGGAAMTALFAIMLWLILGTGIRFGPNSLTAVMVATLVSLAVTVTASPYWMNNPSAPLLMGLVTIVAGVYLHLTLAMIRTAMQSQHMTMQERSQYVGVIADGMRAPLEQIKGLARLLQDQTQRLEEAGIANDIVDSANALERITRDVYRMSMGGEVRVALDKEPFHVRTALNRLVSIMSGVAAKRDVTIESYVTDETPWILMGDVNRLKTVLLNVVGHAVATSNVSQVVAIRTRALSGQDNGNGVSLHIEIQWHQDPQLSRHRAKGDWDDAERDVNVARRQVERLGGTFRLEKAGGGFRMCVIEIVFGRLESEHGPLPSPSVEGAFKDEGETVIRTAGVLKTGVAQQKVLVVEDQKSSRLLIQAILGKAGHRVKACADLDCAKGHLDQEAFDVVVLDIYLQGRLGFELVEHVQKKRTPGGEEVPIIFMTADKDETTLDKAYELGAAKVLAKPVDPDELRGAIAEVCPDR